MATSNLSQPDKMEAGRQLDTLIAERVMGWSDFWQGEGCLMGYPPREQAMGIDGERAPVPEYSTDIKAAWEVLEKMRERLADELETWGRFCEELNINFNYAVSKLPADLKPVDICRAALKAAKREGA